MYKQKSVSFNVIQPLLAALVVSFSVILVEYLPALRSICFFSKLCTRVFFLLLYLIRCENFTALVITACWVLVVKRARLSLTYI